MPNGKDFLQYRFYPVLQCNMCGSDTSRHRIIGQRLNQSQGLFYWKKHGISVTVKECKTCGLIFSDPMPVPENIQSHYGIPPESFWSEEDFAWSSDYFSTELSALRELMTIEKGMKSLDIGAGLGKCMISLEKAGFEAYGMEPSIPFFERAIQHMNISNERLQLGMLEEVDYPEGYFDFITFGAVLEHLYDPAAGIARALKWLKPRGIIHIEVPSSRYFAGKLINLYYRLTGSRFVVNISPMHSPFHLYEFDTRSFRELGLQQRFEVVRHQHFVCSIRFFPGFIKPFLSAYMKWTNTGMQLVVWLQKK
jgi:2-polyprenyl-3-methyl-5-hydroxy-6-metoxy-1,4-benzoquinol methylase